ncbi:MAG: PKD domain-containing protein [Anaerolineae bacterium]|jgi:hypothetical protein|nr:PKD domain-containing protein [Anaerolineae bacterium]
MSALARKPSSVVVFLIFSLLMLIGNNPALSQYNVSKSPNWNIPRTILCPSEDDCSLYMWVEPNMTLYVVSMKTNQVAVVPPDGSEARVYDVAEQLQPYTQRLQPGIVPLQDWILLYRFNPFGRGIDILQMDRITGVMEQLIFEDISQIVSCAAAPHISRRSFFAIDDEHIAICSEGPVHHFNVHVVNVISNTVEQTLELGVNNLEVGLIRPWLEMEVGLDGNIYFVPYADNAVVWAIDIPEDIRNYQIKYDIDAQTYSLSPLFLPEDEEGGLTGPILVDQQENKYIFYRGGFVGNYMSDIYKIDRTGRLVWHLTSPPLPNFIATMNLVNEDFIAVSDMNGVNLFSIPFANADSDQTIMDSDNSGSETIILDGSASTDSDRAIVSYLWTLAGIEIATGVISEVSLDVGIHEITLTVTDDDGLTAVDTVTITIEKLEVTPTLTIPTP